METHFDHNKLLKKIAKDRLKPYGIIQKGSSRTFLYDNAWYVIIIEFQPSSWDKGSYLNIGVDLNFYPQNHLAFSYGSRDSGFKGAENENQFTEIVNAYCNRVIEKIQKFKEEFKDISTAIDSIKRLYPDNPWNDFDLGILYGLNGQIQKADSSLKKITKQKCNFEYEFKRQKSAAEMLELLADNEKFVARVQTLMVQSRQLKKLPPLDVFPLISNL
jgi:chaperonin cofactor prefoldin